MINEVLTKSTPAGEWIKDFVGSDNPKFAGKSAAKRKQMALAAYYSKQDESHAGSQNSTAVQDMEAVEYKGIGTDVVDKKKKLNPQPNFTMAKKQVKDFKEEKDNREYGYEGDMAMSQLKTIIRHSEHLMGMLKPDTDLPEWVQSKITLATDYMQTTHDYLMSEVNEEVEQIDESSLHRKHFQMVADLIKDHESAEKRKELAQHHAELFKKENPRFDHAKFMKAAGVNEEVEQIDEGENGLAAKSKKSGISLSTLKTVYKRGVAAWNSGHRPGTTPQQWGMARVNSYITKGSGTYGGADKDLHEDARLNKTEYHKGMSDSTAKARVAHWKKADKLSDSNPKAYKPAPGDKDAKTTPSVHTKKYHAMYGEAKVYDPFTKKMVATKPIKVQAGGGATRNGVPVETGPSKYKSKLPMSKAAGVLAAEEVELIDEISKKTADSYLSKVTKDQVGKHGMQPNMFDKLPKNRQQGVSNALKRLISPERPSRPGDIHGKSFTEEVQIDEVSKSTLMRYIPKASRDVADHVAMAKERQVTMAHATHAGNYDMAKKESGKSQISFKKAMQRLKGIDTATKKLGTQKEEVELDEAIAKKLPVQHAVDAVHATLGPKSATRFLSHLSPGSDKHTSWDKVNDALVKQGVQTHHIASIAQKTSHMNEEVIDESRGHKVLNTFFKNREVAQRAYQGNPAKDAEVAQGGGSPADQGIAAVKADYKKMNKENVNPALMAILKKRQEAQKKKAEDKKKVNEVKAPAVHAAPPKKTKSTAKEYASASIPGTKRVAHAKPDDNEVGGGTATRIAEDQYTSEYKIKSFVDPVTGENKTRKIRPHRINFKSSKMNAAPAQMTEPTKVTEDDKVYDEKWKKVNFKDFTKGAK